MKLYSCRRRRKHAGVSLLFTLTVLTILIALALLVTRSFVTLQQERRLHERRMQAEFLVQAGFERAEARYAESSEYRGEVWRLESASDGLASPAEVTITIGAAEPALRIKVEAAYNVGIHQVIATDDRALSNR